MISNRKEDSPTIRIEKKFHINFRVLDKTCVQNSCKPWEVMQNASPNKVKKRMKNNAHTQVHPFFQIEILCKILTSDPSQTNRILTRLETKKQRKHISSTTKADIIYLTLFEQMFSIQIVLTKA